MNSKKSQKNKNWQIKKLGDICDIYNGSTPLKSRGEYWDSRDIPWFTIKDIRLQGRRIRFTDQYISKKALEENSIALLPNKTVLLCCTASVGEWAITEIELTTNQQFNGLVVRDRKKVLAEYLYYFVSTLKDELLDISGKTTIDFISLTKLKTIEIPLPSLSEQKRIVEILDGVFGDILIARENVQKNLANAKELFESYLESIFTNEKLRKKNEKWEEKKLGEVCDFQGGSQPPKQTFIHEPKKDYIRFLQIRDFKGYKTETYIPVDKKNKICKRDDVLIGRYGASVGNILRGMSGAYNVALMRARSHDIFNKNYFYYYLISDLFQKNLLSKSSRSAQDGFNKSDIYNFEIPLPSLSEQKQIVKKLDALSVETKKLEKIYQQKIDDLDELKKAVLKKAFAGEL